VSLTSGDASGEIKKMGFDEETTESHERRITRCKSCRARIIWFETADGKKMPVDADTVEPHDTKLDLTRHISHFKACPQANQWRKR